MRNLLDLPIADSITYQVSDIEVADLLAGRRTATLEQRVHELATAHLDGEPGVFLLTSMADLTVDEAGTVSLAVSQLLGRPLSQDGHGALLRQVMDRGLRLGEGATGRYSDSRDGGNLHTDGPHYPSPVPDCFALFCLHQARTGGELRIVHAEVLLERLPVWVIEELRHEFHFDRRDADADPPTVARPILSLAPLRICYLREYVEIGHRHPHVPALTPRQVAALDALDALLDDPEVQSSIRLEPGQLIVINNRSLLHGRTAFVDAPDGGPRRLMLRTWIQRTERAGEAAM
ncbi:MAG TPA: TauD/TfdA family dioxygenase [Jatrophihabitans sp.]|uniref:TauD/TfdA family dioxygenase n=1 Tax=Jatrophihabitans sp. TaxID=1932789 RepID=UPI002F17B61F